jgi:lactate permease
MLGVLKDTCKQMSKTIVTMLAVLGVAKIMGYSGMISSIAAFFVGTLGAAYPLVAPLLGALGTFVTGSGTSSEVLFGNVQLQAAKTLGVNDVWLVASNSLGVSAGKMISPQNIAIGTAACALVGKDGEILGKVFKYSAAFVVAMMVLVFVGAMMLGPAA